MSKDKYYVSIFLPQMEAIVFIILQIFFAMHTVLKIVEYSQIFPSFGWGIFGHLMCLDQPCASEIFDGFQAIISIIMSELGCSKAS